MFIFACEFSLLVSFTVMTFSLSNSFLQDIGVINHSTHNHYSLEIPK
jgi:hypothetical protein